MSYRKIEPSMWDDERFAPLSKDAKLAWLCILTGPHTTPLPGLFVCGIGTLSESLRDDFDTVSKAVRELSDAGLIRFNPTTRVMQVPNAPKYNPCANPKVLKGWFTTWKSVPDCAEKYAHIARVRDALGTSPSWVVEAWAATFGTVKVPDRYRTDTVSDTVSISGASTATSTGAGAGSGGEPPPPPANDSDDGEPRLPTEERPASSIGATDVLFELRGAGLRLSATAAQAAELNRALASVTPAWTLDGVRLLAQHIRDGHLRDGWKPTVDQLRGRDATWARLLSLHDEAHDCEHCNGGGEDPQWAAAATKAGYKL